MKETKEPENGLIIVDTSVLGQIAQAVDNDHDARDEERVRWGDPLLVLARHGGFRLVVPEMVAWESARMIRKGRIPDQDILFDQQNREKQSFFENAYRDPRGFLKRALARKGTAFSIEPPDENATSDAANFMRSIWYAVETKDAGVRRKNFIRATDEMTQQFGDLAIEDSIRLLPEGWTKPVFLLTEDNGLYRRVRAARKDLTICRVSAKGYLRAIDENRLFAPCGINSIIYIKILGDALARRDTTRWNRHSVSVHPITDSSHHYDELSSVQQQDHLFLHTIAKAKDRVLAGIAAERKGDDQEVLLTPEEEERLKEREEEAKRRRLARYTVKRPNGSPASPGGMGAARS